KRFIPIIFETFAHILQCFQSDTDPEGTHHYTKQEDNGPIHIHSNFIAALIRCWWRADFKPNPSPDELNRYVTKYGIVGDDDNTYITAEGFELITREVLHKDF